MIQAHFSWVRRLHLWRFDLKMPIHLILIGFVYFMETLSVIMQTAYFKYTKKKYGEGRRIFKMSPIHHHFEMCGWKEKKKSLRYLHW